MVPDQSALAPLIWLVVTLSKNTNIQKRLEILRFGGREGIGLSLSFSSSSCVRLARDLEHGLSASLLFIITTLSLRKRKGVIIMGALSAFFLFLFSPFHHCFLCRHQQAYPRSKNYSIAGTRIQTFKPFFCMLKMCSIIATVLCERVRTGVVAGSILIVFAFV